MGETKPKIGDVVRYAGYHDGHVRIGVVRDVIERPGDGTFIRPDFPHTSFCRFVEIIEAAEAVSSTVPQPSVPVPNIGDRVRFYPYEGAAARPGRVMAVHLLRSGEVLICANRVDSPLCKLEADQ